MAQCRFGNTQHASGGREATAVNYLHKVEEVVQVKHERPHRPLHWTLSFIVASFSTGSPATISPACRDRQSRLDATNLHLGENVMSDPTRPYEPLTAENAALVLVDYQVGLFTGVRDF